MLQRTIQQIRISAARGLRVCLAGGAVIATCDASLDSAHAQIVKPAIGRFHSDRTDPANAYNIEGRYLQRQSATRFRERKTHLGWEVRGESFVVFANSSRADALAAAATVESTWADTLRMADYFTDRHHQPNFSVAAIAVHVDQNPRRDREEGTLRFTNDKTHVYLNVAAGDANLKQQLGTLRASTVHAFWWRSEYQRQIPEWVRSGLASYVAAQQALANGDTAETTPPADNLYDPYWERERIAPDQLAPREVSPQESAVRVRYLLEGDDARHAPAFFAALRQAGQQRPAEEQYGGIRYLRPNNQVVYDSSVDDLYSELEDGMGEWLSNPMVDQPIVEPIEGESIVSPIQAEMAFVLKIAHRMGEQPGRAVQMKIIGDQAKQPVPPTQVPLSVSRLEHRLINPSAPLWATLDPHGQLLLSNQTERVRNLLHPASGSYRGVIHNGHSAIEAQLDRRTKLIAWMEENPDSLRQPLVKFERVVADFGSTGGFRGE